MASPLSAPQLLFCASLAFSTARTLPALVRYYKWFSSSGLAISRHRGYGQTACRLYGVFGAPKLSVRCMAASGVLFLCCLVVPNLPVVSELAQTICFGLALLFYHLYFSQLYCEAHVGAHVTVMVPHVLVLLALSPARCSGRAAGEGGVPFDSQKLELLQEQSAAFTAWLVKLVLAASYGSAGASKIASSWQARRAWWDGASIQASVFEALLLCRKGTHFSFGVPTPFCHEAQVFAYMRPRLLAVVSFMAVLLEAVAPLVLLLPPALASRPFAVVGISFHYGIAYLQNVDFVSWWGPAYAFFFLDPAAVPGATEELFGAFGAVRAGLELAPARTYLCLAYMAANLTALVALHFFPGVEILPFSSYPMFKKLNDLFNPANRKWVWLSDKPHATGTLKNYCFPFCREQCVQADELDQLPFKYLLMGYGGGSEEMLYANFTLPGDLRELLWQIRSEGCSGAGVFISDPEAPRRMLAHLLEARAAFDRAGRDKPSYCPPSPAQTERRASQCATSETLGETDSTWSARSSRSGEQLYESGKGKLSVFDDIAKSFSGSCAGEGPLRVLCTKVRVLEEVLSRQALGRVAMTLLSDEPSAEEAVGRLREQGHDVTLGTHEDVAARARKGSKGPFDAVLAEREHLCELPPAVLSRGARVVVV